MFSVYLLEADRNTFRDRRRNVLPHEVRPDRQLSVTPIDHNGKLDGARSAEIRKRVECRPDRTSGEEHVVGDHDGLAVDVLRKICRADSCFRSRVEIVAIHPDVETAGIDIATLDLRKCISDSIRKRLSSRRDADKNDICRPVVSFNDLVGDSLRHPPEILARHHLSHPLPPGTQKPHALAYGHLVSFVISILVGLAEPV